MMNPSTLYTLFQSLASAFFCVGLFYFLREIFSLKKRILLLLASTLGVSFIATNVSGLASGGAEGQSYFGALAAQILGIGLFLKFVKASAFERAQTWKVFSLVSGLVYALLRVGCHFRGCCWGRICPYSWAKYYKSAEVVTPWLFLPLHPVQLYSAIHGVLCTTALALYLRSSHAKSQQLKSPAQSLGIFLVLMGGGRLATDYFRADAAFYKQSWWGFYPNTLISVVAVTIGLSIILSGPSSIRHRQA